MDVSVIVKNLPADASKSELLSLLESLSPVIDLNVSIVKRGQRFTSALVTFASSGDAGDAIDVFDSYKFTSRSGAIGSLRLERVSSSPDSQRSTPEDQQDYSSQLLNEIVQCEVSKQLGSFSRTVSISQPTTQQLLRQEQKLKKESDALDIQLEIEKNTQEILNLKLHLKKLGIRDHQGRT